MKKEATSFRLSNEALRLLREISEHHGISQAAALEWIIRAHASSLKPADPELQAQVKARLKAIIDPIIEADSRRRPGEPEVQARPLTRTQQARIANGLVKPRGEKGKP